MNWKERYGLLRSWIMYYGKPFNRKKLNKFYRPFIQEGSIVFDIGAHLGNRTETFLDLGAQVIAVEPQPNCIRFLERKFSGNTKFRLVQAIVSGNNGKKSFHINTLSPTISTARDDQWKQEINKYSTLKTEWDQSIEVKTITLDQLISDFGLPVFCKIDTEGFEWEVLQGLSIPIQYISIEYLHFDKERTIACIHKIASLADYDCNFSPHESQKWIWPKNIQIHRLIEEIDLTMKNFTFGDLYFFRRENKLSAKLSG